MNILVLVLIFFAGCLCGLLNVSIENGFLKKTGSEKNIKKPIFRTLTFGLAFLILGLILNDFNKAIYIFTMFFFSYLIAMLDLRCLIIPNKLIAAVLIASIIFLILGIQNTTILNSLGGLLIGFVMMAVPYYLNVGIGGGDVKLTSVIGFCVGYMGILYIMILVGILTLIYMIVKSIIKRTSILKGLKDMLPMGPFITLSFMIFILVQSF